MACLTSCSLQLLNLTGQILAAWLAGKNPWELTVAHFGRVILARADTFSHYTMQPRNRAPLKPPITPNR